jgi:hypothetical protein
MSTDKDDYDFSGMVGYDFGGFRLEHDQDKPVVLVTGQNEAHQYTVPVGYIMDPLVILTSSSILDFSDDAMARLFDEQDVLNGVMEVKYRLDRDHLYDESLDLAVIKTECMLVKEKPWKLTRHNNKKVQGKKSRSQRSRSNRRKAKRRK